MNYLFNILIMLLVIVPFGDAHAKNNKKIPPNTHPYIIEIKPTHKIKELLGVDISNDGRGIIKKQHIHRLFGAKNNLNKRKKRIEKKISLATSKKEQKRLKKRLKRIQKKITARKKMKKDGKLKYKEKVFILHVNNTIDEQVVLNALQQHPAIKSVSKSYQMKPMALPNDPFLNEKFTHPNDTIQTIRQGDQIDSPVDRYASRELPKLWYLDTIQMNDVWKDFPEVTGEGVVVAVIDSGLKKNHEDIQSNLWTNPNPGKPFESDSSSTSVHFTDPNTYENDINGWNYVAKNNNILDDASGHGSHVSGTIAAVGNNGKGLIGIAPNAKIMTLKIFHQGDASSGIDYYTLSALDYAINKGADVINMSIGSSERLELSYQLNQYFSDLFEEAKNEGIVITIAAGNSRSLFWIVKKTAFYSSSNPEIDRNTSEEIWNELNAKNIFDEYGRLKLEIDVSNDQLDLGLSYDNDAFKGHILNVLRNIRSNETRYEIPGEIFNDDRANPKAYNPAWHAVNHENILTVAATTWSSDNTNNILKSPDWSTKESLNEHLASFSNFSSRHITHGRNNPIKVAAPGVTILSLKNSDATDQYIHKQGTSMATPIVAGLAALVIGINPDLTAKEVVDLIVNHTDKTVGTDLANSNYTGAGRINAYETISHALNSTVVMNPLDNHTIYTPTFNITGKTQQNTPVEIIKHSNNNIIGQGVSDDQGEFNITVTPNPTEYMTRRVFEIIASASITTNEMTRQVQSKPLRLKYKIVDIQPELDTIESLITTPTLNITGTIMKGTPVTLVEQHGQSPQEFEPTIRQIMKGNKEQVTFQIQTKNSRNPIERKYKLKDTWGDYPMKLPY